MSLLDDILLNHLSCKMLRCLNCHSVILLKRTHMIISTILGISGRFIKMRSCNVNIFQQPSLEIYIFVCKAPSEVH